MSELELMKEQELRVETFYRRLDKYRLFLEFGIYILYWSDLLASKKVYIRHILWINHGLVYHQIISKSAFKKFQPELNRLQLRFFPNYILLVMIPPFAIMTKHYGESENRLVEKLEATRECYSLTMKLIV